ncbi:MAG: DUF421 domain-containing protein [Bacilli bacterium]
MYLISILKTAGLYLFIIFVYRLMGKKEVGELSIVDLIVTILIAELAALTIEDPESSVLISIIPIIVLVAFQIGFSYISLKNVKIRNFVEGKPTTIIKNGKIVFSAMSKLRYSLDDLIMQLREQSVKSIEEVDYAVLENDGKLSVFQNCSEYPMPVVIDGIIDYDVLDAIKKDDKWLMRIIKSKRLNLEDIFYAFYTKSKLFIITKKELL